MGPAESSQCGDKVVDGEEDGDGVEEDGEEDRDKKKNTEDSPCARHRPVLRGPPPLPRPSHATSYLGPAAEP